MYYGHHFAWFCPIGILIFLLIVGFIVSRICCARRHRGYGPRWSDDSEAILRKRLANGEIDEAEYQKLMEALKK